jgi:hypothetical protein
MIARRHIFHLAGYDPISVASSHRRFRRELATFAQTWGVEAGAGEIERHEDFSCWKATARGRNWAVTSVYEPLDWHDIVRADMERPLRVLLRGGFSAAADFIASGTVGRYFASSLSYAFFFFVPFVYVLLVAALSIALGAAVIWAVGAQLPHVIEGILGAAISLGAFPLLMRSLGKWLRAQQGLADWMFSRDYLYGRRRDVKARIEAFAARIAACARAREADEIVLIGHSLGAILLIDALAHALERYPDLGRSGTRLSVLTVGATIPKLSLHPAGGWVRSCAERVAGEPAIEWTEYQCRSDTISFYKFHPVALEPLGPGNDALKPLVRRIRMREMLSLGTRLRLHMRLNLMRLHYQFVMANERRASYDYFMFVCGPVPAADLARAATGPVGYFALDGSLRRIDPVPAASRSLS